QKTVPKVSVLIAFRKFRQSESEPRLWICGGSFSQVVGDISELGVGGLEVFYNRAAGKRARWTIARRVRLWRSRINGVRGNGRHRRNDVGVERWPRAFSAYDLYGGRHPDFECV